MTKQTQTSAGAQGSVRISSEVIANIAYTTAMETEGVYAVLTDIPSYVAGIIHKKANRRGIVVTSLEDGTLHLQICLSVRYGAVIPKLCAQIREGCIGTVKSMTGLTISRLDIHIASIYFED